jgi:hypothetical protein
MYVRWAIKKSRISPYSGPRAAQKTAMNARRGDLLVAQLVESKRVDGKPRQKVIAYLGSIRLHDLNRARSRLAFWRHAQAAFRKAGLTNEQKHQVDRALQSRVAKPSPDEVATIDFLQEKKHLLDAMQKALPAEEFARLNDTQRADALRRYEASPGYQQTGQFDSLLAEWLALFPAALQTASDKEREEMLALYKDLAGKEYQA